MQHKMSRFVKPIIILGVVVCSFLTNAVIHTVSVSAVVGSEWRAGRIIDDELFYRTSDLSPQSIQAFLSARLPVCDTNGTTGPYYDRNGVRWNTRADYGISRGYAPPYTCLKDYSMSTAPIAVDAYCQAIPGGTRTASQIIFDVSNACGISAKALIVMLEKEQGLISDTWPWSIQYRSAMGYGCPDTAPCDTQYYGLYNQVYNAARQFKVYAAKPTLFRYQPYANNNIYWSPTLSCGSRSVYIENRATAGLYIYTPYQPNQAALDNLYGEGDGCSAYGNRNFWRLHNDWFGSTTGAGYGFVTATNPPSTINPNQIIPVSITITNRSGNTWYADGNVPAGQRPTRLRIGSYTNTPYANHADSAWLGTSNQVKMTTPVVANGDNAVFTFTLRGPIEQRGDTTIEMAPVTDGIYAHPSIGMAWTVNTPKPDMSYQVVENTAPSAISFGSTIGVRLGIKNTGNVTWYNESSGNGQVTRLATAQPYYRNSSFYDQSDINWLAANQVRMGSGTVLPGQIGYFDFNWKAPSYGGMYSEKFNLVVDGVAFMNGSISLPTNVTDYDYVIDSVDLPTIIAPGDAYTGVVKLKNTGPRTWYSESSATPTNPPIRLALEGYANTSYATSKDSNWIGKSQVKLLESSVPTGSIGTFSFTLAAPYRYTDESLTLVPVIDGVKWLNKQSGLQGKHLSTPTPQYGYTTTAGTTNPPAIMALGSSIKTQLFIKNLGNTVWRNEESTQLPFGAMRVLMSNPTYRTSSFSNQDNYWLGTKNQLRMTTPVVKPGETAVFDVSWTAPSAAGYYSEYFTLAIDGWSVLPTLGMGYGVKVQ